MDDIAVYKTKLRNISKEGNEYLNKISYMCFFLRNWCVEEILRELKENNCSILTPIKELKNFSPREMNKLKTKLKRTDKRFFELWEIPSSSVDRLFENLQKQYCGSNAKSFIKQIYGLQKQVEETKKDYYYQKNDKGRHRALDDFYGVKGFLRFQKRDRFKSFQICDVKVLPEQRQLILPGSGGNKELEIDKHRPVKLNYFEANFALDLELVNSKRTIFTFSYDGKDWWVSIPVPASSLPKKKELAKAEGKEVLGIDLGVKTSLTFSNGDTIENPNNDFTLQKLYKKEVELTRKMCHNRLVSPLEPTVDSKGKKHFTPSRTYKNLYIRHCNVMNKIARRRKWLFESWTAQIPWADTEAVVVEKLSVAPWFKNKKWASKLQKSSVGMLRTLIKQQCDKRGIPMYEAAWNYASSQICSKCGYKDPSMKDLGKRTYTCPNCGAVIDRDLNAGKNLAALYGTDEVTLVK